jgi:hypothetical protein
MGGWVFHEDLGWLFLEFSSNENSMVLGFQQGMVMDKQFCIPIIYTQTNQAIGFMF